MGLIDRHPKRPPKTAPMGAAANLKEELGPVPRSKSRSNFDFKPGCFR